MVSPVARAEKKARIVSIPGLVGKLNNNNNSISQILRILVPGKIDANIEVTINSNDGNFVPDGLSEVKVDAQRVLSIPLSAAPTNQTFSVIVNSDQPILASVLTNFTFGRSNEITWTTGSDIVSNWSVNLTGSRPILTFVGKKLSGTDFIAWQSPVGLNRLQVTALEKGISGGVILLPLEANIGISSLPMNNGGNLETASEPISDASVITRR